MAKAFWQAGFGLEYPGPLSSSIFTRAPEALAVKQPQSIPNLQWLWGPSVVLFMQGLNIRKKSFWSFVKVTKRTILTVSSVTTEGLQLWMRIWIF